MLCTGLYELSRLMARGERPGLANVIDAWRRESRPPLRMGLLLFALGTAWVAVSALLFWIFLKEPPRTPLEFLRYAAVEQGSLRLGAMTTHAEIAALTAASAGPSLLPQAARVVAPQVAETAARA